MKVRATNVSLLFFCDLIYKIKKEKYFLIH